MANPSLEPTNPRRLISLRVKAETALEYLCISEDVPAAVRERAARTLLELVGALGPHAKPEADQWLTDGGLEPESLSLADIDRELGRLGR